MTIYVGKVQGSILLSDNRRLFCTVELAAAGKLRQAIIYFEIGSEIITIPSDQVTVCLPDGRTGPFVINEAYTNHGIVWLNMEQSPNWKGWTEPVVEAIPEAPEAGIPEEVI